MIITTLTTLHIISITRVHWVKQPPPLCVSELAFTDVREDEHKQQKIFSFHFQCQSLKWKLVVVKVNSVQYYVVKAGSAGYDPCMHIAHAFKVKCTVLTLHFFIF